MVAREVVILVVSPSIVDDEASCDKVDETTDKAVKVAVPSSKVKSFLVDVAS